ncbi:serine/threonine-protein kinase fhke-related [Anaeramoeba flamelloides]|uniref:Serine/threonine-protein kinase fhke-related n=1 Tax=Anaeramoeba flamelloides TaxID=1746091 RepID=A0AAV7YS30_9EUKA|nr:serine/threonine-protein kinase fhke-related [Anaeramoeba flamelloides]
MSDESLDTCKLKGSDEEEEEEEVEKQNEDVFGKLISIHENVSHIQLYKSKPTIIGRHPNSTFVISFNKISSKQCQIEWKSKLSNQFVVIKDYSTNGTFVNGRIIGKGKQTILSPNDVITFLSPPKQNKRSQTPKFEFLFEHKGLKKQKQIISPLFEYYDLKNVLGRGQFAQVRLAIEKSTGDHYAVKIIEKKNFCITNNFNSSTRNKLMDEANVLKKISHPNVVNIKDVFDSEDYLFLVLEYVSGGELFDKICEKGKYSEEDSRIICKQLLDVLQYLHSNGIVHRDLKPENILLTLNPNQTEIKVADFGVSRIIGEDQFMRTIAGTPCYLAPEIINCPKEGGYGKECDCWSLGVVLYILLSGEMPFQEDRKEKHLFAQIIEGDILFPNSIWKNISLSAQNLVRRLLTVEVEKRITIKECLNHPWILKKNSLITDPYQTDYSTRLDLENTKTNKSKEESTQNNFVQENQIVKQTSIGSKEEENKIDYNFGNENKNKNKKEKIQNVIKQDEQYQDISILKLSPKLNISVKKKKKLKKRRILRKKRFPIKDTMKSNVNKKRCFSCYNEKENIDNNIQKTNYLNEKSITQKSKQKKLNKSLTSKNINILVTKNSQKNPIFF